MEVPRAPSVSVLMTVYNGERYLGQALDALRGQTYEDFEVIVVDDGSTDHSRDIVGQYAASDGRIRLVVSGRVGRAAALNRGLSECAGEFVAVNDVDDISVPNRLATQVAFLKRNPDVVLVGGWAEIIDESDRVIGWRRPPTDDRSLRNRMAIGDPIVHSTVMYRRDVLIRIGGFNETLRSAIDYDAIVRCLSMGKINCVPLILVKHRRHEAQYFRNHVSPTVRWRTSARIAIRAAWGHAAWMLPVSFGIYVATMMPFHGGIMRAAQAIHTRIVHGRHAV